MLLIFYKKVNENNLEVIFFSPFNLIYWPY